MIAWEDNSADGPRWVGTAVWCEYTVGADGTASATDVRTGYRWLNVAVADGWFDEDDSFDQIVKRAKRHAIMRRFLGAVVRGTVVLYWRGRGIVGLKGPQVGKVPRAWFFASLRDWTRGRHWDRRHRYKVK